MALRTYWEGTRFRELHRSEPTAPLPANRKTFKIANANLNLFPDALSASNPDIGGLESYIARAARTSESMTSHEVDFYNLQEVIGNAGDALASAPEYRSIQDTYPELHVYGVNPVGLSGGSATLSRYQIDSQESITFDSRCGLAGTAMKRVFTISVIGHMAILGTHLASGPTENTGKTGFMGWWGQEKSVGRVREEQLTQAINHLKTRYSDKLCIMTGDFNIDGFNGAEYANSSLNPAKSHVVNLATQPDPDGHGRLVEDTLELQKIIPKKDVNFEWLTGLFGADISGQVRDALSDLDNDDMVCLYNHIRPLVPLVYPYRTSSLYFAEKQRLRQTHPEMTEEELTTEAIKAHNQRIDDGDASTLDSVSPCGSECLDGIVHVPTEAYPTVEVESVELIPMYDHTGTEQRSDHHILAVAIKV